MARLISNGVEVLPSSPRMPLIAQLQGSGARPLRLPDLQPQASKRPLRATARSCKGCSGPELWASMLSTWRF